MKVCKAEPHVSCVNGSGIVDVSALFIVACFAMVVGGFGCKMSGSFIFIASHFSHLRYYMTHRYNNYIVILKEIM